MKYIKILDDQSRIYPYSDRKLRFDNFLVSFPNSLTDEIRARYNMFPVVEEAIPQYDERTQNIQLQAPELLNGVWTAQYLVIDKTQAEIDQYDQVHYAEMVNLVKIEAHRRIVQVVPEWKQLNLLARSTELVKIGEQNWTAAEREEVVLIESIWDKVKQLRAKSDELEAISPIPDDYQDDKYWT